MKKSIRKSISILMIITLCSTLIGCKGNSVSNEKSLPTTYKDIPGVTEQEIISIEKLKESRQSFSYGVLESTEAFEDENGILQGFAIEFSNLLKGLFNIDFIPTTYEWIDLIQNLESGLVDFTGEFTASPVRKGMKNEIFDVDGELVRGKGYIMSEPIAQRLLRVTTKDDIEITTENELSGLKIGFIGGTTTEELIRQKYDIDFEAISIDVPYDAPKGKGVYHTAVQMIQKCEIDGFIDEATSDQELSKYTGLKSKVFFDMVHTPVSLTTTNKEFEPIISVVNKYIASNGSFYLNDLYLKGDFSYSKHKLSVSLTDREKSFIKDLKVSNDTIKVGYQYDNYPICFYNEEEKMFQGIAVDVLNEIGQLTDIEFDYSNNTKANFNDVYDNLLSKDVDMLTQVIKTDERAKTLIWGEVQYSKSNYCMLSRIDFPFMTSHQIHQLNVGVVNDIGKQNVYHHWFPENNNLFIYASQYECLDALSRGDIDLMFTSEYNLLTEINYREYSGVKINFKINEIMENNFAFLRENNVLRDIVDKAQEYVDTERIEMSWTGKQFDYSKKLASERTTYMAIIISILFIVLTTMVFVIIRMVKLSKELQNMARHDSLTGILNRRYFMELAQMQLLRLERIQSQSFIIIFDLDKFKRINDTYGHIAGDRVLRDVAQRVKKTIREYDIFGRYGGEEFIILMSDNKGLSSESVKTAVERIRREIERRPVKYDNNDIYITASFGIASVGPKESLMNVVKDADDALYYAKENGRNRVVFSDDIKKEEILTPDTFQEDTVSRD